MNYKNNSKLPSGIKDFLVTNLYSDSFLKGSSKGLILEWTDERTRDFKITIEQIDNNGNTITNGIPIEEPTKKNKNSDIPLKYGDVGFTFKFLPFENGPVHDIWLKITVTFSDGESFEHLYNSSAIGGAPITHSDANKGTGGG